MGRYHVIVQGTGQPKRTVMRLSQLTNAIGLFDRAIEQGRRLVMNDGDVLAVMIWDNALEDVVELWTLKH